MGCNRVRKRIHCCNAHRRPRERRCWASARPYRHERRYRHSRGRRQRSRGCWVSSAWHHPPRASWSAVPEIVRKEREEIVSFRNLTFVLTPQPPLPRGEGVGG